MENVFASLRDYFKNDVLFNPSIDDYYLYAKDDMIVVSNLITRAPMHKNSREKKLKTLLLIFFQMI
jgi:hypothetical protein